jgi:hypothetical protein
LLRGGGGNSSGGGSGGGSSGGLEADAYRGERARELLRGGNPRISAGNAGQWAGLGPPGFAKDFLVFAVAGGAEATLVQAPECRWHVLFVALVSFR